MANYSKHFDLINTSSKDIQFEQLYKKLKPFIQYIPKDRLPIPIEIKRRVGHWADMDVCSEKITVYINVDDDIEESWWAICHQFMHYLISSYWTMQQTLAGEHPKFPKAMTDKEYLYFMFRVMQPWGSTGDVYARYHDLFPDEIFCNTFATMITGRHYKYGVKLRLPKTKTKSTQR